jgi:UDP-galactopyranose mutase
MKYDYLIVGSGLFGATFAYKSRQAGKTCLVIDKRPQLGGNVYCEPISLPTGEGRGEAVINVHKYGAHIFHTSNKEVWDFVNSIVEFNRYTNSPVANYKGQLYNLPFNMNTFNKLWGVKTPAEATAKIEEQKADAVAGLNGREPSNLEEQALTLVGKDIFEKLIKEYTEKQWGRKCTELPAFIIRRLPVRLIFDNNYFNDKYQGIPIGGYNKLIEGLLASPQPSPVGRGSIETLTGIDLPLNAGTKVKNLADGGYREMADLQNYDVLKENAKQMRKEPTEAEKAFWEIATSGQLEAKFRRQHIIGDYIVDFVCFEKKLIVEIDGGYHDDVEQQIEDNLRSEELKDYGFAILRLRNEEVIGNPEEVIRKVKLAMWLSEKVPLREGFREAFHTLVYCGPIDQYFGFQFGKLDWRTVTFKTRIEDTPNYQGNAVVNYTSHDEPYTRVIEHKHFEMFGQEVYDCPKTVVSEEYSTEYKEGMEPYYPVNNDRNNALAESYRKLAHQEGVMFPEDITSLPTGEGRGGASTEGRDGAVIFGGRLAEYKYYDMAPIIEKVLNLW